MALALHNGHRMTHSPKVLSSFLYLSLAAIAGCGGDSFATDPGESVLVDSTTSFAIVSSGGGLIGPRPEGACDPGVWTYTVHLDSSELAWDQCDYVGTGAEPANYVPSAGSRTLTATELDVARNAAREVHVSERMICGADKPTWHMSVTSPAGSMVYGDDFYACLKKERAYVDGEALGNLYTVLRALAHPTL